MELLLHLARRLNVPDDVYEKLRSDRNVNEVRDAVAQKLASGSFLLILDDVWNDQQPKPFKDMGMGVGMGRTPPKSAGIIFVPTYIRTE